MNHMVESLTNQALTFDYQGAFNAKILGHTPQPNKKKILGFQINGIGNGHLTQAKTMYNILIEHYDIPLVLIYAKENTNGLRFDRSEVVYISSFTTPETTNSYNLLTLGADILSVKPTQKYEESHDINFWINFLVADVCNFRTVQLFIGTQCSTTNLKLLASLYCTSKLGHLHLASILKPSMLTPIVIPPLIDIDSLASNPRPNRILCYSVSGEDYPQVLRQIAKRFPAYRFDYFLNYKHSLTMPNNVVEHLTSSKEFRKYQQNALAVLCTSGNELIQECAYLKIPVASMACSEGQEEQVENWEYYTSTGWCEAMTEELDIDNLVKRNVSKPYNKIRAMIKCREKRVLRLIERIGG